MSRHHQRTSDAMLLEAIRRKAMRDIAARASAGGNSMTNNVYGSSAHHGGGVMDHMAGEGGGDPADRDYFVDIERNDHPEGDGWTKKVHRYTKKKS